MLNKDEYNQDEYNDYYRQETEGAELNGEEEESGVVGKLIAILVLLALIVGGYFGYKAMNASSTDSIDTSLQVSAEPSLPQSVQAAPEEETPTVSETKVTQTVTDEVQKAVSSKGKMSPDDVASIVAAVMQQMKDKNGDGSDKSTVSAEKKDLVLMHELSDSEVDSVSANLIKELEGVNIDENTHIDNTKKQVDVYNKINVQNVSGNDALSKLSDQINNEINSNKSISSTTTTTNEEDKEYSTDIKKEVVFRKNEMRIIIVKKGDTLGKLAKRAYGNVMEYKRIYRANPEITRPDRIYIGQKIRIPN